MDGRNPDAADDPRADREFRRKSPVDDLENLPLHRFLTFRLSCAQSKLNAQAQGILRNHGDLTLCQWRVLMLTGTMGPLRLSDMVKESSLDKGLLSRAIGALVKRGFMEGFRDEKDQRNQRMALTARGTEAFEAMLPRMMERQRRLYAALTEEELDVLISALVKLEIAAEDRTME